MKEGKGVNRRKSPRVKYPCLIIIQDKEIEESSFMVESENLSMGGISITSKRNIKMLSILDVNLDAGLDNQIYFKGKVVWNIQRNTDVKVKPSFYDIGISFMEIDKEDFKRLEKIVNKLESKKEKEDFFIIQRTLQ